MLSDTTAKINFFNMKTTENKCVKIFNSIRSKISKQRQKSQKLKKKKYIRMQSKYNNIISKKVILVLLINKF